MSDKVTQLKRAELASELSDLIVEAQVGEVNDQGRARTLVGWPGQDEPVAVCGHMDWWMPILERGDRVVAMPGPNGPYVLFRLASDTAANFDDQGRRILKAEDGFVIDAGASVVEFNPGGVTRIKGRYIDIEADESVRIFSDGVQIN